MEGEKTHCSGTASSLGSLSPLAGRTTLTALLQTVSFNKERMHTLNE
jgi:hypothetical protein